jgi:hypothetical protein
MLPLQRTQAVCLIDRTRYNTTFNSKFIQSIDECRGFGHMTIHTTPKQWETCKFMPSFASLDIYLLKRKKKRFICI